MRTKNPFCTGTQLAVLRAIKLNPRARIGEIIKFARVPRASMGHALIALVRAGHLQNFSYGHYAVTRTGHLLIQCADRIDHTRGK